MEITSAQNPRIKHLLALQQKSSLRREEGLFVVEGRRELEHCIHAGMQVESVGGTSVKLIANDGTTQTVGVGTVHP